MHQSRSRLGLAYLLVTALGWGLNWPLIKIILRELPPLFARGSSGMLAALLLAGIALWRGQSLTVPRDSIGRLCFASAVNVFAWMGFATLSMIWLTVAEAALLVYTMPIWATLLSWPLLGTPPSLRGISALVLGIAGIAVLLTGNDVTFGTNKIIGIALALASAILFALGAVTARRPIPLQPIALTAWQVGLGCLPMMLLGLIIEQPHVTLVSDAAWLSMAYMTLIAMGVCYLSWFSTLRALSASAAATGMLLVPVIGILSAAAIIGEPLGWRQIIALVLTLGGVALATSR